MNGLSGRIRGLPRLELLAIAVSLLFHLSAAVLSVGHFYPDEHYQTLVFLQYRTQPETVAIDMPWEYDFQMRPWVQPALYGVIRALLPFENPHHQVMTYRLLTALAGFLSLVFFYFRFKRPSSGNLSDPDRFLLFATMGFWLWPFNHARLSAESLSMILLTFALPLIYSRSGLIPLLNPGRVVGIGLLLGWMSVVRPQTGLIAALLCLGIVAARWREGLPGRALRNFALLLGAGALCFGLGTLIDHWGYGNWVFTPWNYLKSNLIEGKINNVNQRGLWYYPALFTAALLPWSLLFIPAALKTGIHQRRSFLTWAVVTFFIFHLALGNKQERFLIPLLPLLVLWFHKSWKSPDALGAIKRLSTRRWMLAPTLVVNFVLLALTSTVVWGRQALVLERVSEYSEPGLPVVYDERLEMKSYILSGVYRLPGQDVLFHDSERPANLPSSFLFIEEATSHHELPGFSCRVLFEDYPRLIEKLAEGPKQSIIRKRGRFFRIRKCFQAGR